MTELTLAGRSVDVVHDDDDGFDVAAVFSAADAKSQKPLDSAARYFQPLIN